MGHNKKEYVGSINTEYEAARIYDEIAIRSNGYKVNYYYNLYSYLY